MINILISISLTLSMYLELEFLVFTHTRATTESAALNTLSQQQQQWLFVTFTDGHIFEDTMMSTNLFHLIRMVNNLHQRVSYNKIKSWIGIYIYIYGRT